jgi:hypothetical protein
MGAQRVKGRMVEGHCFWSWGVAPASQGQALVRVTDCIFLAEASRRGRMK